LPTKISPQSVQFSLGSCWFTSYLMY